MNNGVPEWWPASETYIIGDCLEGMRDIPDRSINLIIADPPYNENKAQWDNIKDYYQWWDERVQQFARILKESGVFYFFHMNFETSIELHKICLQHGFVFRQMIVLNKGLQAVAGRTCEDLRSFPKATEYLFYYTFADLTGSEQLSDTYHRINPMSKYLRYEFERSGVTQKELRTLFLSKTGGETGCVTNWIKGYNFPLKEQYETMREYINGKYGNEYLRREYEDLRYTFNLPYGVIDVWDFDTYAENVEHPTPKPVKCVERIIKASSNELDVVYSPFLGSGTDILAGRRTNRIVVGHEINPGYEQLIINRAKLNNPELKNFKGLDAFTYHETVEEVAR